MTAWDIGCYVFGMGLVTAFVDAATGCQIARALRKVLRGKAPHLRGRKPADGMQMPAGAKPMNSRLVDVHPTADPGMGVDAEWQVKATRARSWLDAAVQAHSMPHIESFEEWQRRRAREMANRLPDTREQAGLADARAFHAWLDDRRIEPPTVFEYEALREDWQRKQAAEVSPLDRARLAAWSASLRGEASVSLPLDQYRAALEHHFAQRVWRDPGELPHLYGVRLAVKAV